MLSYQVEHLGAMVESAMKLIEDYKSFVVRVNMGKWIPWHGWSHVCELVTYLFWLGKAKKEKLKLMKSMQDST